jgi:hypothetical protein
MTRADWIDFILRLTTKYDTRYVIGALADPGDLLEYFLSIVPGTGRMCAMDFKWSTRSSCVCQTAGKWTLSEERGIAISITSNAPLIHHIRAAFNPEEVYDYRCDLCQTQSSVDRPAIRQRVLLSLPRFLKISIIAPLTSAALPADYHQHGPLREFEELDLTQLAPQPQRKPARYTLRAAIMYSKRHHWTYLHDSLPIFVSDNISRAATPADIQMVARCARILIYERTPSPISVPVPRGLDDSVALTSAIATPKPCSATSLLHHDGTRVDKTRTKPATSFQERLCLGDQQTAPDQQVPEDNITGKSEPRRIVHSVNKKSLQ